MTAGRTVARLGRALVLVAGVLSVTQAAMAAPDQRVFQLALADGKVAEGMRVVRVREGDAVRLRWTTNKAMVLHLHGYDVETRVVPGAVTEMAFEARATGRFPIEAHGAGGGHHHAPVAVVEVHPR